MKDFFENPALLVGLPLAAVGVAGLILAVGAYVAYWFKPYQET